MPDPTQANRRIELKTPLGPDVLMVRRASVREQLNRLFQVDLDLISKRNDINFDEIVGKSVTLRLDLPQQKQRFFNGRVNRFVQTKSERSYAVYRASVVPWLWFLTRNADCRIFQASMQEPPDEMTVPGIIKKVFKDHGFEDFRDDGLSATYREWEFCVQYRETAFNFVSRLMEQEGITYFFEHEEDKHTLVLADSINAHQPFENYEEVPYHPHTQGARDQEAVTDWVVEKEVQPTTYILNDFNFENPRLSAQKGLVVNSTIARQHEKADGEIYDYPGEFLEFGEGETVAKLRIEELQARFETGRAQATAMGVSAGYKFKLKNHPRADQNREYLITSVSLEMDAGEFEAEKKTGNGQHFSSSFTAMDATHPFRPPRITPKPMIHGVQTAMVVGPSGETIHTDKYGRIKVHFHWDRDDQGDDNSSCWIRVSQPWGGKNWGGMFVPHVGQEVVVSFEEGDPDCPLITGRVYNPDQMPPLGLPDNKTKSVIRDHGGNEIIMEGKDGEQFVQIKQTCGNEILMNGKGGEESIKLTDHAGNLMHMNAVGGAEFILIKDKYGNEIKLDAVAKFMRLASPTHNSVLEIGRSIVETTDSDNKKAISGDVKLTVLGTTHEYMAGWKHSTLVGVETKVNLAYVIERGKSKLNTVTEGEVKIDSQVKTTIIGGWGKDDHCRIVLGMESPDVAIHSGSAHIFLQLDKDIEIESPTKILIEAKGENIKLKAKKIIIEGDCDVTGVFHHPGMDGAK